jgi:cytochrome c-type biogenesis protein CcmE
MTHRNIKNRKIKIAMTAVVLASAFGFMMWTTLRDGAEYFKNVDEVAAQRPSLEGKQLQVHGYVIPGSRMFKPNSLEIRFKIQNNPIRSGEPGQAMSISYNGIVPDTFKDEAEVVLKGKLTPDGGFNTEPNGVIAKCPSKYEAAGRAPAASPSAGS